MRKQGKERKGYMDRIFKKTILFINSIAMILAMISIDAACVWVHYQPKVPEDLQLKSKENKK